MRLLVLCLLMALASTSLLAQGNSSVIVRALKQGLIQAQYDSTRLRLCVAIGEIHMTENQFDSLYRYTQRGFKLLKKAPSDYYAGDLYHFLARYYRHKGLYQRGISPLKQAIYHAQKVHSVKKTAMFHYTLAMIYSDAGDLSSAVNQIGTNLNYLQNNTDEDMLGANYLLMIELFKALNNSAMQTQYTNRYLALVTPSWPHDHQLFANELKAEILEKEGQFKAAGNLYQKAMRHARHTNNPVYVIGMLSRQGANQRNQQHNQAAIQLFNEAFTLARTIGSIGDMADAKREIAKTYLAIGQPREALAIARYALTLSRQNKQMDGLLASLKCLVDMLEANGLYREALAVYQEHQQQKERHFSETNMQKIAQMQAKFEAETKEKTIKILQNNAQINQLKTIRQQQQLTLAQRTELAAVIIIGLLLILTGVVYHFLRKSQRNYSALTQQQQLLQQTARELAETNGVKDKLFSLISHDLRSPVARMKTDVRQIRQADSHHLVPLLGRLEKQVDTVLNILTNLLDWSMSQLKGFQLVIQPVLLHEIIADIVGETCELLAQKQLVLINQVDQTHVAMADKHQLRIVVRNILGNAIKFTAPGGFIRLESVGRGATVELHIRDTGIGMSADQLATLWSAPLVRPGTIGESGIGLGLRLCREMVDQQGGNLHIDSRPQRGTLVRIGLPVGVEKPVQVAY